MALNPLIAICGTTGVGKSRLAVELALEISGKIINADAMQVYHGLDILTNKIQPNEQRGVEHVLMSFKKPGEQYVVGEWVRDATREIDKAHAQGKVPIVVGGTAYWIHHLLFSSGLPAQMGLSKPSLPTPSASLSSALTNLPEDLAALYQDLPSNVSSAKTNPDMAFALHSLLSLLDPLMASRWHWKDTRKVLRNLEIIKENGRPASEVVIDVYSQSATLETRTLVFWLYAEPDVLKTRIEQRVDSMLSQGLLDEIRSMQEITRDTSWDALDFTLGIFQAIGFREFYTYINRQEKTQRAYDMAVAEMKQNTIKYAKRQVKWIRNKMLPALQESGCSDHESSNMAYLLDATDLSVWEERVLSNAKESARAFLSFSSMLEASSMSEIARKMLAVPARSTNPTEVFQARRKIVCPFCTTEADRPFMVEEGLQWEAHRRTTMHKRMQRNAAIEIQQTQDAEHCSC